MNKRMNNEMMQSQIALIKKLEVLSAHTMNELSGKVHEVAQQHREFTVFGAHHVDGQARILILPRHSWQDKKALHTVWLKRPPLCR